MTTTTPDVARRPSALGSKDRNMTAVAAAFGTSVENYDFIAYSTASALYFGAVFFPESDPFVGTVLSFATPPSASSCDHSAGRLWREPISTLMRQLMTLREGVSSPLRVNVVFHVDGNLVPTDFTGVRTGRFNRNSAELMVQVALPSDFSQDQRQELLRLLHEAVDEAEAFARKRKISDGLAALRSILNHLPAA